MLLNSSDQSDENWCVQQGMAVYCSCFSFKLYNESKLNIKSVGNQFNDGLLYQNNKLDLLYGIY